jgi:DNA-directed RNA polymerase subunit beta'
VWREIRDRYGRVLRGRHGCRGVEGPHRRLDLRPRRCDLKEVIATAKGQRKAKAIKRLKVISAFNRHDEDGPQINSPMGMVLDAVPVIPPGPAPDGAARRWPLRDVGPQRPLPPGDQPQQPLKRLLDLGAPEIIINNEKRMLQEAVDALFDNGRRGRPVTGPATAR